MDNYEPGAYTEGVMTSVQYLTKNVIPEFISQVNIALESLSKNTVHLFDDNQFVDISKKVYDTIHNIRCSVMMIRWEFKCAESLKCFILIAVVNYEIVYILKRDSETYNVLPVAGGVYVAWIYLAEQTNLRLILS
ncbi:hypothetical protein llap_12323 [Limosa lapponica baueri]|uniref:Uncharacterized protein n=1 Tax=Limosa lapponica baueri TaxID=1758121 RepID=A0A2I0TUC5_LIMLA|nr:hypothetical protein llap_12323 [Limosa lapponica baueri]